MSTIETTPIRLGEIDHLLLVKAFLASSNVKRDKPEISRNRRGLKKGSNHPFAHILAAALEKPSD